MTAPYRGPSSPMPFPGRSMARVMSDEKNCAMRFGDPELRKAKTAELIARKEALGISYGELGRISGLWWQSIQKLFTGKHLGSLFTLSLIEQALERGEGKKSA